MADYQPKPGDIAIFTNHKRTTDKHPLLTGKVLINIEQLKAEADANGDVNLSISLWGRDGAKGTFWSGVASPWKSNQGTSSTLPPGNQPSSNIGSEVDGSSSATATSQEDDLPF